MRASGITATIGLAAAASVVALGQPQQKSHVSNVTWASQIAPLVDHSCSQCHYTNGPAPFSLLSFSAMHSHALQIAQVTASGYMPPWLPQQGGVRLQDDRRLTAAQIALLKQWSSEGAPEGDPANAPPTPKIAHGWLLGAPDKILRMAHPFILPAETTNPYRCFVLPIAIPNGKWLRAVQFRPVNRLVVRHATLYADPIGIAQKLEFESGSVGYAAVNGGLGPNVSPLAQWAVGDGPTVFPQGIAERLPHCSDLVLLLRFETDGQSEPVQSEVGLYYSSVPPQAVPVDLTLGTPAQIVQAGQLGTISATFTLPVAARVLSETPHGNPVCRTLVVQASSPAGPSKTLLEINDWNADWQDTYRPAAPLVLSAGTKLKMTWTIDNTKNNPRNPSYPPMTQLPGLFYMDQMATMHFTLIPENPSESAALQKAAETAVLNATVRLNLPNRHG